VVTNIIEGRDDISWGPNNTFRFPLRGGTGEVWRRLAQRFSERELQLNKTVVHVNTRKKSVHFADGSSTEYDVLISTLPLDAFVGLTDLASLQATAQQLLHSTVHIVGIGLRGAPPPHLTTKCWMYFPEDSSPYYRGTVFSNYSPNNVPDISKYWSLMLEVSESPAKPVHREAVVDSVISGLLATRLIANKNDIVDVWQRRADHGYPTPSLGRDAVLNAVHPALEALHIYSRGRFGAWKYEVSNQDHSLMQGVELINHLAGAGEEETFYNPNLVNTRRKK
jgi:protoporphyrinogen oxidase